MTWNTLDPSVLSFGNNPDAIALKAVSWNLLQPLHMYFKCLDNSQNIGMQYFTRTSIIVDPTPPCKVLKWASNNHLLCKICVPWEKYLIEILISSLGYKNYLLVLYQVKLFFILLVVRIIFFCIFIILTLTEIYLSFVDNGSVNLCWWFFILFVKLKTNDVIFILFLKLNFPITLQR